MFYNIVMINLALQRTLLYLLMGGFGFVSNTPQFMRLGQIQKDIDTINSLQTLWTAEINYFSKLSEDEVRARMGSSKVRPRKVLTSKIPSTMETINGRETGIPKSFDARKRWPLCKVIQAVKDQSVCGGCWAVATASAYSDRRCIDSNQKIDLHYSAEDLLTCCGSCKEGGRNDDGCKGGYVDEAWKFIQNSGVVTGGDYGSQDTCKPYSIAPCQPSENRECPKVRSKKCQFRCTNRNYKRQYFKDKNFVMTSYTLDDFEAVQRDIMTYGPLVASFITCYDFRHYRKGVYFHVYGSCDETYHSVKVVGWGEENNTEYWLALNTWNSSWGDNGTFKIHKTLNNCDFGYFNAGRLKYKRN